MNASEAQRAVDLGRNYVRLREWERAVKVLRRSLLLSPLPEASSLLHEAIAGAKGDPLYCHSCFRFLPNCHCGGAGSARGGGADNGRGGGSEPSRGAGGDSSSGARPNNSGSIGANGGAFLGTLVEHVSQMLRSLRDTFERSLALNITASYRAPLRALFVAIFVAIMLRLSLGKPLSTLLFRASAAVQGASMSSPTLPWWLQSIAQSIFFTLAVNLGFYAFTRLRGA